MSPRPPTVDCARPLAPKVEALAGFGLSADEIARVLEGDLEDLQATYAQELDSGAIKANARVAESLYRQATGDGRQAVTAAIFWLKTRARWKEVHTHEHAGVPDSPLRFEITWVPGNGSEPAAPSVACLDKQRSDCGSCKANRIGPCP